ncbi:very short patch repair endonuclease [Kaistia algarum]|uniref:very short patch repair endonuclease n=1 Tax=Kaistia algarum TaxID=2083279 RepID=UPI000CE857D6|nr:very short patch repair endonuclease [Kaistia algarum]MCX5511915.1 very short patch repair endonuclease [Kaistia algarum]PPE80048.1 very short patch repair endonuclease [Kaistia algarum]
MQRVGSRDTRPELVVRRALHAAGFRFRLHDRSLPGTPDIVLARWRTAIFVHGCFWHRHEGCRYSGMPKTRTDFWSMKFDRNVERDRANRKELQAAGWCVVEVWECEIKRRTFLEPLLSRIRSAGIEVQ